VVMGFVHVAVGVEEKIGLCDDMWRVDAQSKQAAVKTGISTA